MKSNNWMFNRSQLWLIIKKQQQSFKKFPFQSLIYINAFNQFFTQFTNCENHNKLSVCLYLYEW